MKRAFVSLVCLGVAISMSGCSTGVSATPSEQHANGTTLLAAPTQSDSGMDAQIAGTLTRTDSGCLAVASGVHTYVLQFPFGTQLADDGESANVPGLGNVRIGDRIEGGGGYIDLPAAPEECRISAEFALWQKVKD